MPREQDQAGSRQSPTSTSPSSLSPPRQKRKRSRGWSDLPAPKRTIARTPDSAAETCSFDSDGDSDTESQAAPVAPAPLLAVLHGVVRLRDCPPVSLDARSAQARRGLEVGLDDSLLHRSHTNVLKLSQLGCSYPRPSKPIGTWSKQELSLWATRRDWQYPNPVQWRHDWKDDRSDDPVSEEKVRKQLERWSVRCPLCLLYRDTLCDDHPLAFCPRADARQARSIRARIGERLVELQEKGIQGYDPVPWCGDCCLPRSCCPAWVCRGSENPASDWEHRAWKGGDDYACRSYLARKWSRRHGNRCQFREVVVNAVSAMCAFSIVSPDDPRGYYDNLVFQDRIKDWCSGSRIRFNQDWDTDGWLLSPMPWGQQDAMVMLRIFCQLDVVVEDLWIEQEVDRRRVKLQLPIPETGYLLIRQHHSQPQRQGSESVLDQDQGILDEEQTSLRRSLLQKALDRAEWEYERAHGYLGDSAYYDTLRSRVRAWSRGGIRCQVCMMYKWSEDCYLHDMESCTLHKESKAATVLLHKWSGIRASEVGLDGERHQCSHCRFPVEVCRYTRQEDGKHDVIVDEGISCILRGNACAGGSGVEIVCRTVAALLAVADSMLGNLVIQEEMREQAWDGKYDHLSQEWVVEQVRIGNSTVPRIVRIFQRLLDGYEGLRQVGWE